MRSLLSCLLLIVIVALTPGLLVQIHSADQARKTRQHLMQAEAIQLVQMVSEQQQRINEGADQLLTAMGSGAFTIQNHPEICQRLLANLMSGAHRFLQAVIVDVDGHDLCLSRTTNRPEAVADRDYFKQAMRTGAFTTSEYMIGRLSGQPTVHLAKSFNNPDGSVGGVAIVSLNLDWLADRLARLPLPRGAVVSLRDRNGVLLARYPYAKDAVGKPLAADRAEDLTNPTISTAILPGLDGTPRLSAYGPVDNDRHGLRAAVALDLQTTFAQVTGANEMDVALILAAAAWAIVATLVLGTRLVRRPFQQLQAVAIRWKAGELSARTGIPGNGSEFGSLAAALDAMAAAHEARKAALRESEELYRRTFEQASVGMCNLALDATVEKINGAACAAIGRSPDDVIGHPASEFTHPDDRAADAKGLRRLLSGEATTLVSEKRYLRSDGAIVWGRRSASLLRDPSGRPSRIITIIEDITARKAAQSALEKSETRLQLAREAAGFGIWDRDMASDRISWSDQLWAMRGLQPRPEGILFDDWLAQVHPDDRNHMVASLEAAIADDATPYDATYRTVQPDGATQWFHTRAKVVRDRQGKAVRMVGLTMDVTEDRETEAQLRRLTTDLEARVQEEVAAREAAQRRAMHAERMQALGQLAGGIAHDFNNVLQMVIGASTLIEDDPADAEQTTALARLITEAADRGGAITRRLLTVGRNSDLRAETLNVAEVLGGLREIFVHTLGTGIDVEVRVDDGVPDLLVDRAQLETSLINLATNARDAMPKGGRLLVSAATEIVQPGQAAHPAGLAPGCYARLCVTDTGSGMDATTLAHVGEPFFTTKKAGAGTGLGMAMLKGFAEQSGGGLDVASQLGQGAKVTLWLPTALGGPVGATMSTDPDGAVPARASPEPTSPCVLVVDDEAVIRQVVAQHLTRSGFQALLAADAAEALAILDRDVKVDAIVTDLSMPGMDGAALIQEAKIRRPRLPAILLTGYAGDGISLAINGAINGSYSLLSKPVTGPQLIGRVRALLTTRTEVDS